MSQIFNLRKSCSLVLVLCIAGVFAGCGNPSDESRQNRRVVDAVLTAVTLRNTKELEKDTVLLDKRLADGLLAEKHHKAVKAIIEKAKSGNWREAEDELYSFRESCPFPK